MAKFLTLDERRWISRGMDTEIAMGSHSGGCGDCGRLLEHAEAMDEGIISQIKVLLNRTREIDEGDHKRPLASLAAIVTNVQRDACGLRASLDKLEEARNWNFLSCIFNYIARQEQGLYDELLNCAEKRGVEFSGHCSKCPEVDCSKRDLFYFEDEMPAQRKLIAKLKAELAEVEKMHDRVKVIEAELIDRDGKIRKLRTLLDKMTGVIIE